MSHKDIKIVSVVGARPNFVKLAPVSRALRRKFNEIIVHTGQHYDYLMDRIFFQQLGIPDPDYHLEVGSGSHGEQTGKMLAGIEKVLIEEEPDFVLVFGDTNSTLAGGLAASKLNIKVVHVEAGLRSFNRKMPEEINRVLVDHCSEILSCPTKTAVDNLRNEGIVNGVYLTGDVMVDVMQDCLDIAQKSSNKFLHDLGLEGGDFFLVTVHRAENTDDPRRLRGIVKALIRLGGEMRLVFPCHPRTKARLEREGLWDRLSAKVDLIDPVGYLNMLLLESSAHMILTDSGGVQKEAYMLNVPCVTMRDETEWVETVLDGWNVLVGSDENAIYDTALNFIPTGSPKHVFGDGTASDKILAAISGQLP